MPRGPLRLVVFFLPFFLPITWLACAARPPTTNESPRPTPARDALADAATPLDAAPSAALTPVRVLAPRSLVGLPDAWDPTGHVVGQRHGTLCMLWDLGGTYRGAIPDAVCERWRTDGERSADGQVEGAAAGEAVAIKRNGASLKDIAVPCVRGKRGCGDVVAFVLSADGSKLAAYRAHDTAVSVLSLATRKPVESRKLDFEAGVDAAKLAWSADGSIYFLSSRTDTFFERLEDHGGKDAGPEERPLPVFDGALAVSLDPRGGHVASLFARRGEELSWFEIEFRPLGDNDNQSMAHWLYDESQPVDLRAAVSANGRSMAWPDGTWLPSPDVMPKRAGKGGPMAGVAVSPDGTHAAFVEISPERVLRILGGPKEVVVGLPGGTFQRLSWSGDGKHVLVDFEGRLEVRGLTRGAVELFWASTSNARFSPEGALLAAARNGGVEVRDVASNTQLFRLEQATLTGDPFSPDGDRLAALTAKGIVIVDATSGRVVGELPLARDAKDASKGADPPSALAWSRGKGPPRIALLAGAAVSVYSAESQKRLAVIPLPPPVTASSNILGDPLGGVIPPPTVPSVVWSEDGARLAVTGDPDGVVFVDVAAAKATRAELLTSTPGFTPDLGVALDERGLVRLRDHASVEVVSPGFVLGSNGVYRGHAEAGAEVLLGDPLFGEAASIMTFAPRLTEGNPVDLLLRGEPHALVPGLHGHFVPPPTVRVSRGHTLGDECTYGVTVIDDRPSVVRFAVQAREDAGPTDAGALLAWTLGEGGTRGDGGTAERTIGVRAGAVEPLVDAAGGEYRYGDAGFYLRTTGCSEDGVLCVEDVEPCIR